VLKEDCRLDGLEAYQGNIKLFHFAIAGREGIDRSRWHVHSFVEKKPSEKPPFRRADDLW
jgi:hypothetical protein